MNSVPCFCIGYVVYQHVSKKLKFRPCCNQTNKQNLSRSEKPITCIACFSHCSMCSSGGELCKSLIQKVYRVNCDRQVSYHSNLSIKKVYFEILCRKRDLNICLSRHNLIHISITRFSS